MSRTARAGRGGPILLGLAVLLLGGMLLFLFGRPYPLERSAIGFEGLGTWLGRNGVAVKRLPPAADDPQAWATRRILPLYDNDMSDTLVSIDDGEDIRERLGPLSPRDMTKEAFERRIGLGTTLVILPKWRGGIVGRGRAHPDLLIPLADIWFFGVADILRRPAGEPLREWKVTDVANDRSPGSVTLYAPQVLGSGLDEFCKPVWRADGVGSLLAWCEGLADDGFFVLSDPDLLDNHGLTLGDNSGMAIEMMRVVAPNAPIYLDPGGDAVPGEAGNGLGNRDEDFADPSRFFRYPFSLAWLGVGLLLLLLLWRGNVRFGLPRAVAAGFRGFQSKRDTIRASGRLMRLAGNEGELIRAYALARMEALSDMLLGKAARLSAPGSDPAGAVLRFLDHRAPELGARLTGAYRDLAGGEPDERRGYTALGRFESAFQEILDAFGRASLPSRRDRA